MVRKSTNAVEQTHNKSNRRGKQLTLLQAILESLKLDIQDVQQNRSYNSYGLRHRYATQTLEASFLRHMARSESARQTESNSPELNIQDQDQDHIFFPSSSSGRPLQRTPSRRGSMSRRGSSRARSSSSQVSLQRVATANSHEQYQNTELQNLEEELKINNLKAELLAKQIEIKKRERELRELELENGGQH
ncbi:uncharacterized protein ACHE_80508A [Aspergillus chevalieri]|nr:uncharacterized protein ACHE_80508A [Aspergillus chevalieri]BCR92608.1 hypothetical protein ACHE_80508A [Aspergillus chevalieri]